MNKRNLRNLMNKAWQIARTGAHNFGGRPSDYFAASLKLAWYEARLAIADGAFVTISGNTFPWKKCFRNANLKWNATKKAWEGIVEASGALLGELNRSLDDGCELRA